MRMVGPDSTWRWGFPDAGRRRDAAKRLAQRLSSVLDAEHDRSALGPGFSFVLVVDGEIVLLKAKGMADQERKRPVTPETIFRIASITKTFTAASVLALRDEGKLSTSDTLALHLPELDAVYPHSDNAPIRIDQVLTHSAGFASSGPYAELPRASTEADLADAMTLPLVTDPGIGHRYSNLGFGLLGVLVARKAGVPYRDFVRTRFLEPLHMTSSGFDLAALPADRIAVTYASDGSARTPSPNGVAEGAGGLWSTAPDLALWIRLQLAAWPPRDDPDDGPLRRSTLREMHMPRVPIAFVPSSGAGPSRARALSVGLAWEVTRGCYYERLIGHDGSLDGFKSALRIDVDRGIGFALLTNGARDVSGVADRLLDTIASEDLLAQREREPAPILVARVEDVVRRLGPAWTDAEHEQAFGEALRRTFGRADAIALGARVEKEVGACHYAHAKNVTSGLDAELVFDCARGSLRVTAHAEGAPPRLVVFKTEPVKPAAHKAEAKTQRCLR